MYSNVLLRANIFYSLRRNFSYMKISEIYTNKSTNADINVKGWVQNVRKMKTKLFFDISDGSSLKPLQVVTEYDHVTKKVTYGCSVEISGKTTRAPSGQIELNCKVIKIIGECKPNEEYPFVPRKKYKPEEIREHLHFRPRTNTFKTVLRVRSRISYCIHKFFQKEKFVCIHTPVLTSNDCEGAGEIFEVIPVPSQASDEIKKIEQKDKEMFFDKQIFLTVSGQLHLETMVRALCNVYQFGPVFRAENSKSRLHLSEFYMIEAEVAFINKIEYILKLMEKLIKNITLEIMETHGEEIINYRKAFSFPIFNLNNVMDKSFTVMNFDDACEILKKNNDRFNHPFTEFSRLTKEHELFLVNYNNNIPIFVINWPVERKPFYVKISESTKKAVAVDLLFPEIGELCGGSLREDNYNILQERLQQLGLQEKLKWYLELRKYGNIPTGGFGMGFERFLKFILGTASIKDTIPFPRWPHNCQL